jgi:ribosomal protein L1
MSKDLEYLIEEARKHKISQQERAAQVRSFAYGNTHYENEDITKADIDRAMSKLQAERESEAGS